jgi:hypothetical protein
MVMDLIQIKNGGDTLAFGEGILCMLATISNKRSAPDVCPIFQLAD